MYAQLAGEDPKKKRKVIKTIIRRKRKASDNSATGDCKSDVYTGPAADCGDENAGGQPNTPEDAMDQYAQASAEADAARLSMADKNEKGEADSLPATQVDADEKVSVISIEPETFMAENFDDRQRLPEEETFKEVCEKGGSAVDVQDTEPYDPHHVQRCDDAATSEASWEGYGTTWRQHDWSYDSWPYYTWGGWWKTSWDYGYGQYPSWNYYGEDRDEPPRRSQSVDSGLSGLTSVSKLNQSLNRLNTADLEHVGQHAKKLPNSEQPSTLPNGTPGDEKNKEKPARSDEATSPSSSLAPGSSDQETPGGNMNHEGHNGSDAGTLPSSSHGDTASTEDKAKDDAKEEKEGDEKAAEGEGNDSGMTLMTDMDLVITLALLNM